MASFSLSVSSLVALTLIPMMTSQFFKDGEAFGLGDGNAADDFDVLEDDFDDEDHEEEDEAATGLCCGDDVNSAILNLKMRI